MVHLHRLAPVSLHPWEHAGCSEATAEVLQLAPRSLLPLTPAQVGGQRGGFAAWFQVWITASAGMSASKGARPDLFAVIPESVQHLSRTQAFFRPRSKVWISGIACGNPGMTPSWGRSSGERRGIASRPAQFPPFRTLKDEQGSVCRPLSAHLGGQTGTFLKI